MLEKIREKLHNNESKIYKASSSSCHTINTDLPDSLSPPFSIVYRFRWVLKATSCIGTGQLYEGSNWTSCLCSFM